LRGETILSFFTEKGMERIDSMASQTIFPQSLNETRLVKKICKFKDITFQNFNVFFRTSKPNIHHFV